MAVFTGSGRRGTIDRSRRHSDVCQREGCGGLLVRHSLGCGIAVDRCVRCFRNHDAEAAPPPTPGRLRRFIAEFVSWREVD
jgi:hypothetical protein